MSNDLDQSVASVSYEYRMPSYATRRALTIGIEKTRNSTELRSRCIETLQAITMLIQRGMAGVQEVYTDIITPYANELLVCGIFLGIC